MLLFFFLHYEKFKSMGNKDTEIKESIKEKRLGDDMYYNDKIRDYLKRIHKYEFIENL